MGEMEKKQVLPMVTHVPDAIFPSGNFDIPILDISMQAQYLESPVKMWGQKSRRQKFIGTYGFYVPDYKFTALWKHPNSIINTGVKVVIEPNFSTSPDLPEAIGIYGVYQKRWLARYWQTFGVKIVVDLNVDRKFFELNLIGVPAGWGSFATRAHHGSNELLFEMHELAMIKAGGNIKMFIVYGGGKDVSDICKEHGWLHIGEQMNRIRDLING